ncbi:MAG: hypothetical protein AABY22_12835, partial [Nanoarchaeota archaeon]
MKIFCPNRPNRYGDIILSLPHLNWLEKQYPDSYKVAAISPACKQIIPLLYNHPLINNIYVTENDENFTVEDILKSGSFGSFDEYYNPFPQVTDSGWFNKRHISLELFIMNCDLLNNERRTLLEYNSLDEQDKFPKLNPWFKSNKHKNCIAILPETGYGNLDSTIKQRSPTKEFWTSLTDPLVKRGYHILQFGHPKSEKLEHKNIEDCRNLSFFDMIKEILGCELLIGTDTGAMHVINAYGFN